METAIFSLLTLVLIALAWRELDERSAAGASIGRGVVLGIAAALATLARPEGVLLAGIVGAALVLVRPGMSWRALIGWGVSAGVAFLLVLAPYLILNYGLTGGLLPNTAAAKRMDATPLFHQSYLWRIGEMLTPMLAGGQLLLVPGMIAYGATLIRRARRDRSALLLFIPLVWSAALIALYAAWLPLNIQHGRYVIPALPAAIIAGVVGTAWLVRGARAALIGRVLTRVLAISAALVFVLFALVIGLRAHVQDVTIIDQEMVTAARWVAENIASDDLLAVHDIGAVGYFAPRPILDVAGLVTPEIVPLLLDSEAMWRFIEGRGADYLMALENQVPGDDPRDPRLCPVFTTGGAVAPLAGGTNMTIYRLAWDRTCP
jgi:4-amino-4-deoxy-L-arabinose transferase-like glycosyltransferase